MPRPCRACFRALAHVHCLVAPHTARASAHSGRGVSTLCLCRVTAMSLQLWHPRKEWWKAQITLSHAAHAAGSAEACTAAGSGSGSEATSAGAPPVDAAAARAETQRVLRGALLNEAQVLAEAVVEAVQPSLACVRPQLRLGGAAQATRLGFGPLAGRRQDGRPAHTDLPHRIFAVSHVRGRVDRWPAAGCRPHAVLCPHARLAGRAEAAKSDRIGRGRALVVQPLTAALDKLLQVKQRAIERCALPRRAARAPSRLYPLRKPAAGPSSLPKRKAGAVLREGEGHSHVPDQAGGSDHMKVMSLLCWMGGVLREHDV